MGKAIVMIKRARCWKSYRVVGSQKHGFGVEILWHTSNRSECGRTPLVFPSREEARQWAQELARADVHPIHLSDLLRDRLLEPLLEEQGLYFSIDKNSRDCYTESTISLRAF